MPGENKCRPPLPQDTLKCGYLDILLQTPDLFKDVFFCLQSKQKRIEISLRIHHDFNENTAAVDRAVVMEKAAIPSAIGSQRGECCKRVGPVPEEDPELHQVHICSMAQLSSW